MKASEIYQAIDEMAPFSVHASYDNPGFLIGDQNAEVTKVLLALDITVPVVQEAAQLGAELIVSHHPVIFHPIRQLLAGSVCYELAQSGISAICAHTNLDVAHEGVKAGVDTLVTGDAKYHMFLQAAECGLNLIDAGHFATENGIVPALAKRLKERFDQVEFVVSSVHRDIVESV